MQLKLGMSRITHNCKCCKLRKLECLYGKVEDTICNLFGMAEEDVFHIIAEYSSYSGPGRKYFIYVKLYLLEITT